VLFICILYLFSYNSCNTAIKLLNQFPVYSIIGNIKGEKLFGSQCSIVVLSNHHSCRSHCALFNIVCLAACLALAAETAICFCSISCFISLFIGWFSHPLTSPYFQHIIFWSQWPLPVALNRLPQNLHTSLMWVKTENRF